MLVKWKTNGWSNDATIERVECSRETELSVWVMENVAMSGPPKWKERQHRKIGDVHVYHDTWEEPRTLT